MIRPTYRGWMAGVCVSWIVIGIAVNVSSPSPNPQQSSLAPSLEHLLGTAPDGRDMLLLCLFATVRAAGESLWATGLTVVIGVVAGLMGARAKWSFIDTVHGVMARLLDSVGPFLLAACVASVAPRMNSWKLAVFLALVAWPSVSVVVRSEALAISHLTYVEAARAVGVKPLTLALHHYLPAMLDRLAPLCFGLFGGFVALYGALGFIGVGISTQQGLGFMLFDAQSFIRSAPWYWMSCFGAFVLLLLVSAGAVRLVRSTASIEGAS